MEFYLNVISKVKQKCFNCLLLFKWLYSTHTLKKERKRKLNEKQEKLHTIFVKTKT